MAWRPVPKAWSNPITCRQTGSLAGRRVRGDDRRSHPAAVSGLVFVDGASDLLKNTLTPAQWNAWIAAVNTSATSPGGEVPDYEAAVAEIRAAPGLPDVPTAVLTADHPWSLAVGDAGSTGLAWIAAQDRLSTLLHATHIRKTNSGHAIGTEQPRVVSNAIRDIVNAGRHNS
jgi:hypothetical protein